MPRAKRDDYGTGITRTETGWRAFIRVRGALYSKRFPDTATLTEVRDWRAALRVDVLRAAKAVPDEPAPGTFADDIKTYLAAVTSMPTYNERDYHLGLWRDVLGGTRTRASITSADVRAALQAWRLTGKNGKPLSESACNHRRTALMHFYTVLNGRSGANPVRDIPKFRAPDPEARGVPFSELQKIFDALKDTKTKARILVLALTGLPPSTLVRLTADAINYAEKTLTVPRRRKGKGTKTRVLPLTPEAIKAFKLLTRHDAWGHCSRDALRHSLHRACKRAKVKVIRLYDLRHSFGTEAYRASGDIRAVQALLDHSDVKLTERYTLGAVDARMRSALSAMRKVTGRVTRKRKSA